MTHFLRSFYQVTRISAFVILGSALAFDTIADDAADGELSVQIQAGTLNFVPTTVNRVFTPVSGSAASTSELQVDAIRFEVNGIEINDLNGDGQGFVLQITPENLSHPSTFVLPIGTVDGLHNPSDPANVTLGQNSLSYNSGDGIEGFKVDYDIAYDIPAFSPPGTYTGNIRFTLTAQ